MGIDGGGKWEDIVLNFTKDESLKSMDTSIKANAKELEYWGDLNLSREDLDILKIE